MGTNVKRGLIVVFLVTTIGGLATDVSAAPPGQRRFEPLTEDQVNNLSLEEARSVIRSLQVVVVASEKVADHLRRSIAKENAGPTVPAPMLKRAARAETRPGVVTPGETASQPAPRFGPEVWGSDVPAAMAGILTPEFCARIDGLMDRASDIGEDQAYNERQGIARMVEKELGQKVAIVEAQVTDAQVFNLLSEPGLSLTVRIRVSPRILVVCRVLVDHDKTLTTKRADEILAAANDGRMRMRFRFLPRQVRAERGLHSGPGQRFKNELVISGEWRGVERDIILVPVPAEQADAKRGS